MASIIEELKKKIDGKGLKIVFPESNDERIIEAAIRLWYTRASQIQMKEIM